MALPAKTHNGPRRLDLLEELEQMRRDVASFFPGLGRPFPALRFQESQGLVADDVLTIEGERKQETETK